MTAKEFLDKYGDELRGLLLESFACSWAARQFEGKDTDKFHATIGRAMKDQMSRAHDLIKRMYSDAQTETKETPNEQANGNNGHARPKEKDATPQRPSNPGRQSP